MYRIVNSFNEISKEDLRKYRLCYVEEIPKTYNDYTPESKALRETEEFKEFEAKRKAWADEMLSKYHSYSYHEQLLWEDSVDPWHKFKMDFMDYPTEDVVKGYTHYLYFTDDMDEQWGDDWNDVPYEHNAEIPYDSETNIIRVPVTFTCYYINSIYSCENDYSHKDADKLYNKLIKKYKNYNNCQIMFPKDYGCGGNSAFSVDMINNGAVAWVLLVCYDYKIKGSVAIYGGDTIKDVKKKLKDMEKLLKNYI